MEQLHPGAETDASREGTASHELAERMVRSYAQAGLNWPADAVGQAAKNGVVWTQESHDAAKIYADDIAVIMAKTGVFAGPNLKIEERVHAHRIHAESWGTPDCSIFDKAGGVLYLWDYKFGHRVVDAFENWQLITYAVGLLDEITGGNGLHDQHIKIVVTVVQPRAPHRLGPVRRWGIMGSDLRPFANILHGVERDALGDNPRATVGPECRDCSARHACETLQRAAMAMVAYTGGAVSVPLEGSALGLELRLLRSAAEILKARINGLEAQAEAMIQRGDLVPGWVLEQGRGRQRWNVPAADVLLLGDMLGVDLRAPAEPITPKQAIKMGVDATVINGYSETPSTGWKLVESTEAAVAVVFNRSM